MKKYISTLMVSVFCLPAFLLGSGNLKTSINSFASQFYQEALASSNENEVFSPYCLFNCLSMAYIGSDGPTEAEIRKALCLNISQDALAKSLKTLASDLSPQKDSFKLNIANSVWVDRNLFLLPSYRHVITEEFLAHVESLNFRQTSQSVSKINQWVEDQTMGTIPKLLGPQDVLPDTELMLVSALYFKGAWAKPFKKMNSKKEPFYTTPHKSKNTSMMNQVGNFSYYEDDEMQFLLLPFKGKNNATGEMAYFVVLPKKSLKSVERTLYDLPISELISSSEKAQIQVKIPSFDMRLKYDLIPSLRKLGINEAFSSRANFSKINGRYNLYVNKALHEAFFSLNEEGVTASAATAIGAGTTCVRIEPPAIKFTANHPFMFGIVDLKSNVMLFLGKMTEP